jgi:glycerol-3-phosphate cytidylyltransferase
MLEEAKKQCDWLVVGLQTDPSIDRPDTKNTPVQSIVERYIQLKAVKYVDEIVVYTTEKDLIDLHYVVPVKVRILGEEYQDKDFTGKELCGTLGIETYFNTRQHRFSTTELRQRIAVEALK